MFHVTSQTVTVYLFIGPVPIAIIIQHLAAVRKSIPAGNGPVNHVEVSWLKEVELHGHPRIPHHVEHKTGNVPLQILHRNLQLLHSGLNGRSIKDGIHCILEHHSGRMMVRVNVRAHRLAQRALFIAFTRNLKDAQSAEGMSAR